MCIHLMQPTFWSHIEFCQDLPYYLVMFFTAVVYSGYTTVLLNTPHDVTWHLVFNVLHIAMHVNWQMTRRTDPGTIGLQDKGIYQSQYVQAIDEMCVQLPRTIPVCNAFRLLNAVDSGAAACRWLSVLRCAVSPAAGAELAGLYEAFLTSHH